MGYEITKCRNLLEHREKKSLNLQKLTLLDEKHGQVT